MIVVADCYEYRKIFSCSNLDFLHRSHKFFPHVRRIIDVIAKSHGIRVHILPLILVRRESLSNVIDGLVGVSSDFACICTLRVTDSNECEIIFNCRKWSECEVIPIHVLLIYTDSVVCRSLVCIKRNLVLGRKTDKYSLRITACLELVHTVCISLDHRITIGHDNIRDALTCLVV